MDYLRGGVYLSVIRMEHDMIEVLTKSQKLTDKGYVTEYNRIKHEKGQYANVYNGVLTIYSEMEKDTWKLEPQHGIAGYMPDAWVSWEKV